jgi:AcrR family transcriptional regulator
LINCFLNSVYFLRETMGRRSDHSRAELEAMIVSEGQKQIAETGFARFSAREVAKRIGYSIGTLYNVFGDYDTLILAINGRTMQLWARFLKDRLDSAKPEDDRLAVLVRGYFDFAQGNPHAWSAIYDHRLPLGAVPPDWYGELRAPLTGIVITEIASALPQSARHKAPDLARSLVATVHGHCALAISGTYTLLGGDSPFDAAMERVREAMAAAGLARDHKVSCSS